MFILIQDFASLNKIQRFILHHLKHVHQDIGMWLIKKVEFYMTKVLLFSNAIKQYMQQGYKQIKQTELILEGEKINVDKNVLANNQQMISESQSLSSFKMLALLIFDVRQLGNNERTTKIVKYMDGFILRNPEGRLQKQILSAKFLCHFKPYILNMPFKIEKNHQCCGQRRPLNEENGELRKELQKEKLNEFVYILRCKQNLITYLNSCCSAQHTYLRYPSFQKCGGFNYYVVSFIQKLPNNAPLFQQCLMRHLLLYLGCEYLLNELFWTRILRCSGVAKMTVFPKLAQYYLNQIPQKNINRIFVIDRYLRNIRQITKYYIFYIEQEIHQFISLNQYLSLLSKIRQTHTNLLNQAADIDKTYAMKSYNAKFIALNLNIIEHRYKEAIVQIQQILRDAEYYMKIIEFQFWWILNVMANMLNPILKYSSYHKTQQEQISIDSLKSQDSTNEDKESQYSQQYEKQCLNPIMNMIFHLNQTYSGLKVIYSNQFITSCVNCFLFKGKYHQCYEYLRKYASQFENFHHHKLLEQNSNIFFRQIIKFCHKTPMEILIEICGEISEKQKLQNLKQSSELGTIICGVYIKSFQYIVSYKIKKRLLILSAYGLQNVSFVSKIAFTSTIYGINNRLYREKKKRKMIICIKNIGKPNKYKISNKEWIIFILKKVNQMSDTQAKKYIQDKIVTIKLNLEQKIIPNPQHSPC